MENMHTNMNLLIFTNKFTREVGDMENLDTNMFSVFIKKRL